MRVYLNEMHNLVKANPALRWRIIKTISFFLRDEGLVSAELGIILSGDHHLMALNRQYRDMKEPTDVLSFPFSDPEEICQAMDHQDRFILGEIYISVDRALIQAKEDLQAWEKRVIYLLAHGLYHLIGYDHCSHREKAKMNLMVEALLEEVFRSKE